MPSVWEVFYALVRVTWKFRWVGTSGIRLDTQGKEYDCQTYKRVHIFSNDYDLVQRIFV
jgi:hypothetical protein